MPSRRSTLTTMTLVLLCTAAADTRTRPAFGDWSVPVNLGTTINSPFIRITVPAVSRDRLEPVLFPRIAPWSRELGPVGVAAELD